MEVAYHNNDIILKYMSEAFKDTALTFYGLDTPKIKAVIPTELPVLEVSEEAMDFVFLLEDDTYLHLEFQTTKAYENLKRFLLYDARLHKKSNKKIRTAVIYSADINNAENRLDAGSIKYNIENIFMKKYNGDKIYLEIKRKIQQSIELSDLDKLNLIFLPLMNNSTDKNESAVKAVELAKEIKDEEKRLFCIGALIGISDKFIDKEYVKKLKEVLKMTRVGAELREEGREEGIKEGIKEGEIKKAIEVARKLLEAGMEEKFVMETSGLSEDKVIKIKRELEKGKH